MALKAVGSFLRKRHLCVSLKFKKPVKNEKSSQFDIKLRDTKKEGRGEENFQSWQLIISTVFFLN
jgi:hypothetical protein